MSDTDEKALVAQILSSYLSNNSVGAADLPGVIESVKRAFGGSATNPETTPDDAAKTWTPAVSIKKSITPEALICLCCGESFKSLKRHLETSHKLTPARYREAFHLKADYPVVAPNYAAQRSELAKSLGLGRKPKAVEPRKKRGPKPKIARAAAA
jgi:predicted transcriptional regulator